MWTYEKKLQYPVKIKTPNPAMAKLIITQLGGPDGEMGATTRYMNQRYTMPYAIGKAVLTDIATEELDQFRYTIKYLFSRGKGTDFINQSLFSYFIAFASFLTSASPY